MMHVTVKYFGQLAEATGTEEETIQLPDTGCTLSELRSRCLSRFGLTEDESIRLAVNQTLQRETDLQDGDVIAFLPPFAGG